MSPRGNPTQGLRTDARRNRQRILTAARDLYAERGAGVPFDAIAERAGVGNATLYRHFASHEVLRRAVVLDVLTQSAAEARLAMDQQLDSFRALAGYMHRALDVRIAAVMPVLAGEMSNDEDVRRAAADSANLVQQLVDAAHLSGQLRRDVTFGDVGLLLIRLSRPISPIPLATNDQLAHRHLDLVLKGLAAHSDEEDNTVLPDPGLTLQDLRQFGRLDSGSLVDVEQGASIDDSREESGDDPS